MSHLEELQHNNWAQGVMTLISILLGVALSVAASQTADLVKAGKLDLLVGIRAAILFLVLTGTFYYYYNFLLAFYFRQSILWVMILFLVGASDIAAAYFLASRPWFLIAMAVVFFIGSLSFAFTLSEYARGQLRMVDVGEREQYAAVLLFRNEQIKNLGCFMAMGLVAVAILRGGWLTWLPADPEVQFLLVNGAIYAVMLITSELRFIRPTHRIMDGLAIRRAAARASDIQIPKIEPTFARGQTTLPPIRAR